MSKSKLQFKDEFAYGDKVSFFARYPGDPVHTGKVVLTREEIPDEDIHFLSNWRTESKASVYKMLGDRGIRHLIRRGSSFFHPSRGLVVEVDSPNGRISRYLPLRRNVTKLVETVPPLTVAELQRESYETAVAKGWHDKDDQPPSEAIRLIAKESAKLLQIANCIEQYRKGRTWSGSSPGPRLQRSLERCLTDDPESEHFEKLSPRQVRTIAWLGLVTTEVAEAIEDVLLDRWATTKNEKGKPEGLGSELADIIIRVCDDAGALGIDLEAELRAKLAYNKLRDHRHGGKLA